MLQRRGVEDVDDIAGADDFDDAAGVNDAVRVHEGGRGALRRWQPRPEIAFLVFDRRGIMARHEGWPRGCYKDMKKVAAKRLSATVCPQS